MHVEITLNCKGQQFILNERSNAILLRISIISKIIDVTDEVLIFECHFFFLERPMLQPVQ